jgi:hypothetical protein
MGFSPLGGLPMATRSGDLDPGVIIELFRSGLVAAEVEELVTRRSGFLGMTGSADLREVLRAEKAGDERARLAVALFVRRIVQLAGAYFTLLRGQGALVFGGGIGSHSAEIRRRVAVGLEAWGIELDGERNSGNAFGRISTTSSRDAYVFETDEETLIARSVERVLSGRTKLVRGWQAAGQRVSRRDDSSTTWWGKKPRSIARCSGCVRQRASANLARRIHAPTIVSTRQSLAKPVPKPVVHGADLVECIGTRRACPRYG